MIDLIIGYRIYSFYMEYVFIIFFCTVVELEEKKFGVNMYSYIVTPA